MVNAAPGSVCVLALLAIVGLSACGMASPRRASGLKAARSFHDCTVYWLGRSFQGLRLTGVERGVPPGTWDFVYRPATPPQTMVAPRRS